VARPSRTSSQTRALLTYHSGYYFQGFDICSFSFWQLFLAAFRFHLHHSTHFFARRFIIRRIILNMRLADNSRRRIHQRSLPLVTQTHCNCRKKHLRGTSRLARLSIAPRLSALRFHFRGWVVSC
jgi:hypothetical protein